MGGGWGASPTRGAVLVAGVYGKTPVTLNLICEPYKPSK